jgi:hypothetical protein
VQGGSAVAVGTSAGAVSQSLNAVAVGNSAGRSNQGLNAVAVGAFAGQAFQNANSIILNATGAALSTSTSSLYVAPVRYDSTIQNYLAYNSTTSEVVYSVPLTIPSWVNTGVVTFGATTTAPVPGTTSRNQMVARQIGTKNYEVMLSYATTSTSGSTSGTGDYLFTLPFGLSFDQTIQAQQPYTGSIQSSNWLNLIYALPGTIGTIGWLNNGGGAEAMVVPWDATRYRIVAIYYNSGIICWGSGFFQLNNGGLVGCQMRFQFQST